jgi:hypothetical protein
MTIINERSERVVFPRTTLHDFWLTLQQHFAQRDPQHWKYLAMLALRENSGWTTEQIGHAFGHSRGHVSRCLYLVKRALRSRFQIPPGVLSAEDDGFSDPLDAAPSDDRDPPWMLDPSLLFEDDLPAPPPNSPTSSVRPGVYAGSRESSG